MTDELFKKAKELQREILLRESELRKAKTAFAGLAHDNPVARTCIRISVPSNTTMSFNASTLIYPEAEFLEEYIKRLEQYINRLHTEYLAL